MNRQRYHTLHDSLEHLRTDLIDIHRQLRFFYYIQPVVRMSPFMGGTCGASSDAPVPIGRSANLQVLAHPFGRGVASGNPEQ